MSSVVFFKEQRNDLPEEHHQMNEVAGLSLH